jgi:hypothetical protein
MLVRLKSRCVERVIMKKSNATVSSSGRKTPKGRERLEGVWKGRIILKLALRNAVGMWGIYSA